MPRDAAHGDLDLETDNGTGDMGRLPVIRTIATLAHGIAAAPNSSRARCSRRCKILQRGDLPWPDLIGAYAGEIGQTQFLPSSYIKYGVDYDGDGHVDLRHSVPDVLASTANLLKTNGWQAGAAVRRGHRRISRSCASGTGRKCTARRWCCLPSSSAAIPDRDAAPGC